MSNPPSLPSHAAASTRLAHARSLSVKTNTAPKLPANPIPASDVRLFVTNLRLLDFDLRHDWPNITTQTFSAKNADQKQRISGAEWALFRLFEIWDPNETAQKLRPFFPPLEPLQSLNLRAALYRCLNELKKNGVLGRESVLRKTMLDECKGDKFFEILALFSAAVLKKALASRGGNNKNVAVARKLATSSTLPSDVQPSLLPLAIAHKAALVNLLRRKEEQRQKFSEFERTLDTKAKDINKRIRRCMDTPRAKRSAVPQREADAIKRQLTDNWIGNQKWLSVMLHGDQVRAGDAFLSNQFDKVWHTVERGRKLEDAAPEAGLLDNLQSRVQEQQNRLQQWKAFHAELRSDTTKDATTTHKVPVPAIDLKFESHIQHQLPSSKHVQSCVVQRPALRASYLDILTDMDSELSRVSQSKPQQAFTSSRRERRSSIAAARSPIQTKDPYYYKPTTHAPPSPAWQMEPKTLVSEPKTLVREQKALFEGLSSNADMRPQRRSFVKVTSANSDATLVDQLSTLRIAAPKSPAAQSPIRRRFQPEPDSEPTPTAAAHNARAASSSPLPSEGSPVLSQATPFSESSPTESSTPAFERSIPILEAPSLGPEEALADQIITSIGNATPSPVKKPQPRMSMSLVERTRMTLSRTPSFEPVPESPDDLPIAPPTVLPSAIDVETSNVTTLLERTRLSMATMSNRPRAPLAPSQETARKQKQSRSSLFPVNQFETPRTRKSFEATEEGESSEKTPKEDLLAGDIDYDRVFKSRPRIATSPIFSPQKYGGDYDEDAEDGVYEEEITGIDLGDVDQSDDEDNDGFTQSWADSPSRRAGKVNY
ncbi:hypothetical protein N0V95_009840 [Ascochyta clinopodiicola]|nr:hypothetical protein N0V95_009840 [Ascochyta clinopodiicola]